MAAGITNICAQHTMMFLLISIVLIVVKEINQNSMCRTFLDVLKIGT